jgi:hypothetical protein
MQADLYSRLHEIVKNSNKINSLEICTIYYKKKSEFVFLCGLGYKVVCIEILHHCSIHHWLSLELWLLFLNKIEIQV